MLSRILSIGALLAFALVHGMGCGVDAGGDADVGGAIGAGGAGGACEDASAGPIAPTCGGPCAPCELGMACKAASECLSGACVDGVCRESACAGACIACSKAKTGAADGTCAPVKAGNDPDAECGASPATSCGPSGEGCNGDAAAPGCRLYGAETECAAATCVDGAALPASHCDGKGSCASALPQPCAPSVCEPGGA
jgi:hypothetical protein